MEGYGPGKTAYRAKPEERSTGVGATAGNPNRPNEPRRGTLLLLDVNSGAGGSVGRLAVKRFALCAAGSLR